jgi:uncharacterized phage-associated protein
MTFRFHFNAKKAIQAIGVLMHRDRVTQMNYMRLLKLLYLAERAVLAETGRPIFGDTVVAMPRGPILENVYSLIRDQHPESRSFCEYFDTVRYNLIMKRLPAIDELSELEVAAIHVVASDHEDDDEWDLVRFSHENVPEWKKNYSGDSSNLISVEDILDAVGFSKEEIADVIVEEHRRRSATPPRIVKESVLCARSRRSSLRYR